MSIMHNKNKSQVSLLKQDGQTTLAKGHHAQTWHTARKFFRFHTIAVCLIKTVHYYFFYWGRQYSWVFGTLEGPV